MTQILPKPKVTEEAKTESRPSTFEYPRSPLHEQDWQYCLPLCPWGESHPASTTETMVRIQASSNSKPTYLQTFARLKLGSMMIISLHAQAPVAKWEKRQGPSSVGGTIEQQSERRRMTALVWMKLFEILPQLLPIRPTKPGNRQRGKGLESRLMIRGQHARVVTIN